jgi:dihydroorotate dehydrogenase (fumarate)
VVWARLGSARNSRKRHRFRLSRQRRKEIKEILQEVTEWMDTHEYESVAQMIGSLSQQHCPDPTAFERANYLKTLGSYQPVN